MAAACAKKPESPVPTEIGVPGDVRVGKSGRYDACIKDAGWSGGEATFVADMTHPGMVPVVAKAAETSPGCYAGEIAPTMAGDWVITFAVHVPDGRKTETRFKVRASQ